MEPMEAQWRRSISSRYSLALCPPHLLQSSDQLLLSGGYDGRLRLYDLRVSTKAQHTDLHSNGIVNSFAFAPDGRSFVAGVHGYGAMVYDTRRFSAGDKMPLLQLKDESLKVKCVSYDGHFVIAGGFGGTITCWDADENVERFTMKTTQVLAMWADDEQLIYGDQVRLTYAHLNVI